MATALTDELTVPRRDPVSREALARAERTEGARVLHVSIAEHVWVKGGKVAAVLIAAGYVQA